MNNDNIQISDDWEREPYNSHAGIGVRALALLVDGVVFIPVLLFLFLLEWFLNIKIPTEINVILYIIYRIYFHVKKGATIGKKQTELRLETLDEKRINLKQGILHELPLILYLIIEWIISNINVIVLSESYNNGSGDSITISAPGVGWVFFLSIFSVAILLIDILWIFTNSKKRALHNIISRTHCMKK